jgi:NAD(P)-dependent dehydrogenase (short-subunit alcohol dehydrogenase family)
MTHAMSYAWSEHYPDLDAASQAWRYRAEADCLAGKTYLVTGAGDGIGAVTAKTLACFGANVVLLGRSRQPLETVFDWIEQKTQTEPVIVPADLERLDEASVTALSDSISETYGKLSGIVHNASRLGPRTPIAHYPYDEWLKVMQTNVNAVFVLTKGLFELLDASADAVVLNVSSSVGRAGRAYWGAYAVSKFALEGFTQVFADETETAGQIRVYSLNPGGTRTKMRAAAYPMEDPESVPPPEAHMDLYLYLLEGARTGKTLPATGTQLDARDWQPD